MARSHLVKLHSLRSNKSGYEQIASLYREALRCGEKTVHISGARVSWLDANMSAPLAAVRKRLRADHGIELKTKHFIRDVEAALEDVGYLAGGRARKSMVRLRSFEFGQGKQFAVYSEGALTGKGLPAMSRGVRREFFLGIDEIFQNFEIHSQSRLGLFACGQLYPKKARLIFTLADMGIGIPDVVGKALGRSLRPSSAINWAMTGRNTTRNLDVPGGLGLKLLRRFIELNGGSLCVVSGGGYWSTSADGVTHSEIEDPFPGTIVTIEVNTADTNSYQLAADIDPEDIF